MEVVSAILPKLGELLADEYKLQKEAKDGIKFLQDELKSMKAALEDISGIPADELPSNDKIWASDVRELSYDIEDNIDTFMVKVKSSEPSKKHGIVKYIGKARDSLTQFKNRRSISSDIKDIKTRIKAVHERRSNYKVDYNNDKPKIDPRALVRYEDVKKLVGIDEARDGLIKILREGNKETRQQEKIVSIVGFGGLGKTTLANVVFEKLRAQYDCSAFISVSRTPDMDKLFKDLFYQLAKNNASMNVIEELREFLQKKRYLIIFDDIWETSHWDTIRCALPKDDDEYRIEHRDSLDYGIFTTTRSLTVAEQIGGVYKMKPLCLENSRILMYRRVFGKEYKDKCLDEQLTEVSDRILKKCGGVPLAIITIASLLVTKGINKLQWEDVCNSIGAGLEKNIDNMRKVLSLSYYDMPYHLRTCLLYLSMFPEDYEIDKDRLIRLWIAEGCIQCERKESLFEIGESYLCELVNRSMVQAIYDNYDGRVESCRVHDMVLDLICSLSSEENFVTIWKDVAHSSASQKFRRLSLQNGKVDHDKIETSMNRKHVRSVVVFPPAVEHLPTLENFKVLRVLDFGDCDISQGYSLKYLGKLLHLRYLGLRNTCIDQLHEEIGKLRYLQTLEVWGHKSKNSSLPSTIVLLTNLMCLSIRVSGLQQEDLDILGRLPSLCYLDLTVDHEDLGIHGRFTIGACSFPCLIRCTLQSFGGPVVFQCEAMPKLAELRLEFPVQETREINSGFDLGLGNLLLLQDVHIWFRSGGASKEVVKEAKAAVMHAIELHPNHPTLRVKEYFP